MRRPYTSRREINVFPRKFVLNTASLWLFSSLILDCSLQSLINVADPEDQDISTLGDPVYPGGNVGMFLPHQSYQSEEGEE